MSVFCVAWARLSEMLIVICFLMRFFLYFLFMLFSAKKSLLFIV